MDEEAYKDVPRSEFSEDMPMHPGIEMEMSDDDGNPMYARIDNVDGDTITLNFFNPLAGKELHFNVKVVGLRAATKEELEYGHAHIAGQNH